VWALHEEIISLSHPKLIHSPLPLSTRYPCLCLDILKLFLILAGNYPLGMGNRAPAG